MLFSICYIGISRFCIRSQNTQPQCPHCAQNLVIYIYTRRYFLISFKSIRSFLIRFSNLCWWYIDTMQKLTFINESYGFFFEYLFKAWWFFQLDLMAVVVTVDVTVVCFLSFFLWISFKVMIEKADLCLWPIRNLPCKVPVFLSAYNTWSTLLELCWQWKKPSVSMKRWMKTAALLFSIYFKGMS